VHGAEVHVIEGPDDAAAIAGRDGDALVTRAAGVVLAVQTADCGPIVLDSREGVIAVAHAGWRGLEAGVIERTVDAMRELGATTIAGVLGPSIGPECYEFGADDLAEVAARLGPEARARTAAGSPALDVRAAARRAAADRGITLQVSDVCTACDAEDRYFSHRARQDIGRMATIVWREAAP
jgi:YfiH family protein